MDDNDFSGMAVLKKPVFRESASGLKLRFFISSGLRRFSKLGKAFLGPTDGLIFVCSPTSEFSFKAVEKWIENLPEPLHQEPYPIIVVCYIFCLEDEFKVKNWRERGKKLAALLDKGVFLECNVRTRKGFDTLVETMASMFEPKTVKPAEKERTEGNRCVVS